MYKHNQYIELVQQKSSGVYKVKLNLPDKSRCIATINNGTLIIKKKINHLFRLNQSLGINEELLTNSSIPFEKIIIDYAGNKLETTRDYFLEKSKSFPLKGCEPQKFLCLNDFGMDKAIKHKGNLPTQLNLFS